MSILKKRWASVSKRGYTHYSNDKKLIEDVISTRRPSERDDVMDYRKKAIRLITRSLMLQAIDKLKSIFVKYGAKIIQDEEIKDFTSKKFIIKEEEKTLYEFVFDILINEIILDPNGISGVIPEKQGDLLPSQLPDTQQLTTKVVQIESSEIEHLDSNEIKFKYDTTKIDDVPKNIYMKIDKENYFLSIPIKRGSDVVYVDELYYNHNLGYIPFKQNGGYHVKDKEEKCYYYDSFFVGFYDWADLTISEFSDALSTLALTAHPYLILNAQDCPSCDGHGKDRSGKLCKPCNGKGKLNLGPHTIFYRNSKGLNKVDDKIVEFVNAPIESVKAHWDVSKEMLKEAKNALYLIELEYAQSGTAKEYDREGLYSFLANFGTNLLNIYEMLVQTAHKLENPLSETEPTLVRPNDWKLKTQEDILNELKDLREGNAPLMILIELTKQLYFARFGDDKINKKIINFLSVYDVFFASTDDEFLSYSLQSTVTQNQKILHAQGYSILKQIAYNKSGFQDLNLNQVKKLVDEEIQKINVEIFGEQETNVFDEN